MTTRRSVLAALALGAIAAPGFASGLSCRPIWRPARPVRQSMDLAGLAPETSYIVLDRAGRLMEGRGADRVMPAASTQKILTAIYALARLGPDFRFATELYRLGDEIVLVGSGDPTLDSGGLDDLAAQLASASVEGAARLSFYAGALPELAEIAPDQADEQTYNAALGGLNLNFNRVRVARYSDQVALVVEATADQVSPRAYTVQAGLWGQGHFAHRLVPSGEAWSIPQAALKPDSSLWLPVRRPALYAADVFQTLARARDVGLAGPERRTERPEGAVLVGRVESAPLVEILSGMLAFSTNLTAEAIGLTASGAETIAESAGRMQEWFAAQGFEVGAFDHSGLDPRSRLSARVLAGILAGPGAQAGLWDILKPYEPPPDARHGDAQIRAKSGTLNFVSNLAGYARTEQRDLVFAILSADEARRAKTHGAALPDGVIGWTQRARDLQLDLIDRFVTAPARPPDCTSAIVVAP